MKQAIFVHSWFRCSSTYFWSKVRQNVGIIAYYEPLHERLTALTPQDILNGPDKDGARMLRHPEAKRHYFAEYLELVQQSGLNYRAELAYDRYFLEPHEKDDILKQYIATLIEHAQHRDSMAALCFCRSPMRSAWMKENFGGLHIALVRNPLDQWESFKLGNYFVSRVVITFHNLQRQHPFNSMQLGIWPFKEFSRELLPPDRTIEPSQKDIEDQFFRMFFVIWLCSLMQSSVVSDLTLDVDLLSDSADFRFRMSDRLKECGLDINLSDCETPRRQFTPEIVGNRMDAIHSVMEGLKHVRPKFLPAVHIPITAEFSPLTAEALGEFVK